MLVKNTLKTTIIFVLAVSAAIGAAACSVKSPAVENTKQNTTELYVSRDFGSSTVFEGKAELNQGDTVTDLMGRNLKIETEYGGAFIKSINNLSSSKINGQQHDWFYYINGIAPSVGANAYKLNTDDKIYLDYHPWTADTFIPAIVGAYPEPFINGAGQNKGVTILYYGDVKSEADRLSQALVNKGAANVVVKSASDQLAAKREMPTVILGVWKDLELLPYVKEVSGKRIKAGVFAEFGKTGFKFLDYKGAAASNHGKDSAAIVAASTRFGDANPLWIVTAVEQEGIIKAVDLLEKNPDRIKGFYGAGIAGEEVIRLPVTVGD